MSLLLANISKRREPLVMLSPCLLEGLACHKQCGVTLRSAGLFCSPCDAPRIMWQRMPGADAFFRKALIICDMQQHGCILMIPKSDDNEDDIQWMPLLKYSDHYWPYNWYSSVYSWQYDMPLTNILFSSMTIGVEAAVMSACIIC